MLRWSNIKFGFAAALVAMLTALVMPAAVAAIPDYQQFPTGCAPSSADTKQAVKIFKNYNFNTPKEVECGNAVTADLGDAVLDKNFDAVDVGAVENMANVNKSVVFFNKALNYGVCFNFYDGNNFSGTEWSFYLKKKPSGAKYVVGYVQALSSSRGAGQWQSLEAWPGNSASDCGLNFEPMDTTTIWN